MAFPDQPVAHLLGSNAPVHALAYSASPGTYILTGSADRNIRLYNPFPKTGSSSSSSGQDKTAAAAAASVPEGRLIQTYSAHGYEVLSLAVAADNERFVSGGGDRAVFLWDVASAKTTCRFGGPQGHTARINSVCFAGDGDALLVSGSFDTSVRVWDTRSSAARPVQVLAEAKDAVTALAVRDADIVAASVDGRVRCYDVRMGRCTTDVIGASVTSLSLARDGRSLLVGSLDSRLRLMDCQSGACLRAYSHPHWRSEQLRVQSLLGAGEKYVVAGDEAVAQPNDSKTGCGRVWAWNLLTGRLAATVQVPWGPPASEQRRRIIGADGQQKYRANVISCLAWRNGGWGDQFCVGGTSGVVTVFGSL
ncbi:hypothetical protein CDD82_6945 [Ophiocordyceps australis]|uniref:Uncharacterized protein n=1 Tax=Ophiocordyceps australis TaxID=1399860 RepID=A0A2C5ZRZ9_9HYPO|nr:hypothetical protein CDD82_6945 [Ophiocordyceps australis]